MSSRGKKKTTMAKLNREARLRERRVEKQMRKDARRDAAANPPEDDPSATDELYSETDPEAEGPVIDSELEPVPSSQSEAS